MIIGHHMTFKVARALKAWHPDHRLKRRLETGAFLLVPDAEGTEGTAAMACMDGTERHAFGIRRYSVGKPPPMLLQPQHARIDGLDSGKFVGGQLLLADGLEPLVRSFVGTGGGARNIPVLRGVVNEDIAPSTTATIYHFGLQPAVDFDDEGEPRFHDHVVFVACNSDHLQAAVEILIGYAGDTWRGLVLLNRQMERPDTSSLGSAYTVLDKPQ